MPYIDVIPPDKATGLLKRMYDAAMSRGGRDLGHCVHHEPQPPRHEGFAGFLWRVDARPLPSQPRASGDACSRGFGREPLRVLNTIPRPRPPCRGRQRNFGVEDDDEADRLVHQLAADWRGARPAPPPIAHSVTSRKNSAWIPGRQPPEDIDGLRQHGLEDRGIHDAVQIIGFFNYINRVADALGVEPESFTKAWEKQKNGEHG